MYAHRGTGGAPRAREVAAESLEQFARVKGRQRPSTLGGYRLLLAEPGLPHRRGNGRTHGRIMAALGDRPIREMEVRDIGRFLGELDRNAAISPRSVNKYRQVLSAIFGYARRPTTYALTANPVEGTDKRREPPPAVLDFYEPEEIEALARAAPACRHRGTPSGETSNDERAARRDEDAQ